MMDQPISLDRADGVSPGAPNANAEGGDPVGEVAAIVVPQTTLASTGDPEPVIYRVRNEQRRSKPIRSNNQLQKLIMVYLKDSFPGITVGKLCEANGVVVDAEVRFRPQTYFRQRLDTRRKGHREAMEEHGARGAGSKGGGSCGASSENDAGSINAYMDGVKPLTRKMARLIVDRYQAFGVSKLSHLQYLV